MKIDYLKIENFKGITNLKINFGGANAVISGQNGTTGKTTILDAVTWLLTNKMSDGKTAEVTNVNARVAVTAVEMKFDNGLTLRRECNGKSVYFVHGAPYILKDFSACINEIFKGAIPTLLTPFEFCRLHYTARRNILLSLFSKNIRFDMAEFESIAEDLKSLSPLQIIKRETQNAKVLDKELATIPARIDEIKPAAFIPIEDITAEIEILQAQIAAQTESIKKIRAVAEDAHEPLNQAMRLDADALKLEGNLRELREKRLANNLELQNLREEYTKLASAQGGTCPTCGSKVPAANLPKIKARLEEIIARGKALAEKQELFKKADAAAKNKVDELRTQSANLKRQFDESASTSAAVNELQNALDERDALQEKLSALKIQLAESKLAAENQNRVEHLKNRQLELAGLKAACERKIYLAETYIRRQIELTEKTINDQFELVTFKMFDFYKVAEGVKECCEPMLNGVPYAALSKGEQLKVSLDILKTLQRAFDIELPVFIDDAESYTSNSFIDLPNQIIRLVAVEGVKKLLIDVDAPAKLERRLA